MQEAILEDAVSALAEAARQTAEVQTALKQSARFLDLHALDERLAQVRTPARAAAEIIEEVSRAQSETPDPAQTAEDRTRIHEKLRAAASASLDLDTQIEEARLALDPASRALAF